jgi:hypothetical protein
MQTINDLQGFNYGGYQFDATLSAGNHLRLLGSFFHKEYKKPDASRSFFYGFNARICRIDFVFPFD